MNVLKKIRTIYPISTAEDLTHEENIRRSTVTNQDPAKSFYAQHGPFTDPGPYARLYQQLPDDLDALCGIVNGLLVHDLWNNIGILHVPEARRNEANIRSMAAKLMRIQEMDAACTGGPRPLEEPRPFEQRLVGNCRDEALMLCSFLRHAGIPARVRKGFQANAGPKKLDHAVCQVWSNQEQRWRSVDVQMDNMRRERGRLSLEAQQYLLALTPQDTPPEAFLTGGQAWLRCRAGEDDPLTYGIDGDLWGWFMIRHNLLRDLLALNKLELLPWDMLPGGLLNHDRGEIPPDQMAFLDHAAELTLAADEAFDKVRRLYDETPALHVPESWWAS